MTARAKSRLHDLLVGWAGTTCVGAPLTVWLLGWRIGMLVAWAILSLVVDFALYGYAEKKSVRPSRY